MKCKIIPFKLSTKKQVLRNKSYKMCKTMEKMIKLLKDI